MFVGFAPLSSSVAFVNDVLIYSSTGAPSAPDASPTFAVYGPGGALLSVTGTLTKTDAGVAYVYRWSFIPSGANGFQQGSQYSVLVTWAVSSAAQAELYHFGVV